MKLLTRTGVIGLCTAAMLMAQTAAMQPGWQNLNRLRPGEAVRVVLKPGGTMEGRVESWSADGLTLSTGNGSARTLSAAEIKQVAVRVSHARLKAAGIGAGIGFGGGFTLGALAAGTLTDRNAPSAGARVQAGGGVGLFGAGIGALLGALAGGSRYQTVYRSK